MGHEISSHAIEVLSPLLMAAVTWISTKLTQLINARIKNERLRATLLRLDDTISAIVREIEQVTVKDLRSRTQDGQVPPAVRVQLKTAALATVKAYLGPSGIQEAIKALGLDPAAFDAFVATRIEAAVLNLKNAFHHNGVPQNGAPQLTTAPPGGHP